MEKESKENNIRPVNIIIYSDSIINKTIADEFADKVSAGKNGNSNIICHSFDFETPLAKNITGNEIVILACSENNSNTEELLARIKNGTNNYIVLHNGETDLNKDLEATTGKLHKALNMGFTLKDYCRFYREDIAIEKIQQELATFKKGIKKIKLKKPAVINDGIVELPKTSAEQYAAYFDSNKDNYKLTKFVPASGAASRMFKFLNEFMAGFKPEKETVNNYIKEHDATALDTFVKRLEQFPFYNTINDGLKEKPEYEQWSESERTYNFIKTMLQDNRYNFANKPKGVLPFHQYSEFKATPVWEHFKESITYAASQNKTNIHFTISEEHLDDFTDAAATAKESIEKQSGVAIDFSFSYQHKKTDTLAVDLDNKPFRTPSGDILFRPGGHGALIENLGKLDADIVFIKNIDNVSFDNTITVSLYKKALAGKLIKLQEQVFSYLKLIDEGNLSPEEIWDIIIFAKEKLLQYIPSDVVNYTQENKVTFLRQLLNRPIRICGMVKNEGEPGGGPFWVEKEDGKLTLQIVESSQIDMKDDTQKQILSQATHFNPVDLVCGLKNYKGEYFNLKDFVDNTTGFIVQKSRMGKEVKSYELPGLWNGAMAGWITVFAEVPLETFSPVKTVNDLLKPAHQPH